MPNTIYSEPKRQKTSSQYKNFHTDILRDSLYIAAQNGNLKEIQELVPFVSEPKVTMWKVLINSSIAGYSDIVKWIVDECDITIDINATDISGKTALIFAKENQHRDIFNFLIYRGAKIDNLTAQSDILKEYLFSLFNAAKIDMLYLDMLSQLIKNGADINSLDKDGKTMLIHAICDDNIELIDFLFQLGANVNFVDKNSQTPMLWAAEMSSTTTIKKLIECGAKIEETDEGGDTALLLATNYGRIEIVKILLDNAANIEASNNSGDTSLLIASRNNDIEIIHILLDNGASIKASNKEGESVLSLCKLNNNQVTLDYIKLLEDQKNQSLQNEYELLFNIEDQLPGEIYSGELFFNIEGNLFIDPIDL